MQLVLWTFLLCIIPILGAHLNGDPSQIDYLVHPIPRIDVSKNVHFLYSSRRFHGFKNLQPSNMKEFVKKYIMGTPSRETKVLIHGWLANSNSSFALDVKDAYLESGDFNVISVDWSELSKNPYFLAQVAVHSVARAVTLMLDQLVLNGLPPKSIHIIGHSLGAHIAGFAGESMKTGKVARITGLDPAAPFFIGMHLDTNDADFVDIIHTSLLGYQKPTGHADFYPNGGGPTQPGCGLNIASCTHKRAYDLFVASILNGQGFLSRQCEHWDDFEEGECEKNDINYMGEHVLTSKRGKYYLTTAEEPPFLIPDTNISMS